MLEGKIIFTENQAMVITKMKQNLEDKKVSNQFTIWDAIDLLEWDTPYGDPYHKFRLPFYGMMGRIEKLGLIRRPLYSMGFELTDKGKKLSMDSEDVIVKTNQCCRSKKNWNSSHCKICGKPLVY